ncbi:phage tail protein [Streptacidiphilus rugosus]|uniref:phage tail protein n=1 Tax=Streptacidiphilus rugosus TaxID=405783 RepID=UPI00068F7FE6|nr:phage tail protein [Streptacidiphilus rugosus]
MSTNFDGLALANRFKVVLDDGKIDLGYWSTAGGLDVSWELCQYRAGDTGNGRTYYPGFTKYSDIVLTRAACLDSQKVRAWLSDKSIKNSIAKSTGEIYLANSEGQMVMSWKLMAVMPLKWAVDKFDASASKVAIETLTLTHEGFLDDSATFDLTQYSPAGNGGLQG